MLLVAAEQRPDVSTAPSNDVRRPISLRVVRWLGAAVWTAFGVFLLLRVPDGWWRWRDDGVITLSHARGLVQFGHPAVSASGERVEGASAPLQMFVASAFYWLGGSGWRRFMDAQVLFGFALSGWSTAWLCWLHFPGRRVSLYLGATLAAAVLGFTAWRSVGWFGSGMENSLTVGLLLLTMAAATAAIIDAESRGWLGGAAFGLAGVSRVELAGLLLPALLACLFALRRRPKVAVRVAGVAGLCWALVHGWRYLTFGTFIPNSAVVQDKVAIDRSALWWLVGGGLLVVATLAVWRYQRCRIAVSAVVVAIAGRAWWTAWRGDRYDVLGVDRLVVMSVLGLVIVVVAGWMIGVGRPGVWAVLAATSMVPLAQRLLFGKARLDAERLSTMALPLLGVCAALVVLAAADVLGRGDSRRVAFGAFVGVVAVVGLVGSYWSSWQDRPQSLCCSIDGYSTVLADAASIATTNGFPVAIVATPDLGKLSFDKQVVVVDLGRLGDALLTEVYRQRRDLVDEYLTFVAAPDLVEIHGDWACSVYRKWLRSKDFGDRYELLRADPKGGKAGCPQGGATQFYVRIDDASYARETTLAAALADSPRTAPAAVTSAYAACTRRDSLSDCAAVRRAILRSSPVLRATGQMDDVVAAAVAGSPTPELDRLLLTTPPGWASRAAALLIPLLDAEPGRVPLGAAAGTVGP